ncbi:hypothetical protein Trihar35433_1469 [Trichoderma harzianum]|nr:hypothetical protein Trihar35433_1469 [Trichoderma harzianum]
MVLTNNKAGMGTDVVTGQYKSVSKSSNIIYPTTHTKVGDHAGKLGYGHDSSIGFRFRGGQARSFDPFKLLNTARIERGSNKPQFGSHVFLNGMILAARPETYLPKRANTGDPRSRVHLGGELQNRAEPRNDVRGGRDKVPNISRQIGRQYLTPKKFEDDIELLERDRVVEIVEANVVPQRIHSSRSHPQSRVFVLGMTIFVEKMEAICVKRRTPTPVRGTFLAIRIFAKFSILSRFNKLIFSE